MYFACCCMSCLAYLLLTLFSAYIRPANQSTIVLSGDIYAFYSKYEKIEIKSDAIIRGEVASYWEVSAFNFLGFNACCR